jgi:hypothetical protein
MESETENREIVTVDVSVDEMDDWFQKNQSFILHEVVATAEELYIHSSEDMLDVLNLRIISKQFNPMTLKLALYKHDLGTDGLEYLLQRTIKLEEYELSHRLKLLKDYVNETK